MMCFQNLQDMYPTKVPQYLDSLLEVTKIRRSAVLDEFIAMERSKGAVAQSELTEAYRCLGGYIEDETPPRKVVEIYKHAVMNLLIFSSA